jgi:hypothetical protein
MFVARVQPFCLTHLGDELRIFAIRSYTLKETTFFAMHLVAEDLLERH